jgi:PAS domain S-box-containing protein
LKGATKGAEIAGTVRDVATNMPAISNEISMLDAVDVPIIVIGRDLRVARINRAATTALGLTGSDIGQDLASTLAGMKNIDELCAEVIADGAPRRHETRDGDRCFLLRIAPYTGSDGQIVGALLTFTNVTAFRASIDQAIYEREYTKAILNTVVDPLVVLDAKLRVRAANRAFYTKFGVSRDETQGVSIRKLGNTDWEASEVWKSIETTLSDHTEFQAVEIDREFPSMGRRTVVVDARPLEREGDALMLLAFQDITERKQAEQALRESEKRYRTLFNVAPVAVYSCDASGVIRQYNTRATELWGREPKPGDSEERFCGSFKLYRTDGSFMPHEQCPVADVLTGRVPGTRDAEVFIERPDGSRITAIVNIAPLTDDRGQIIGAINCLYDVTERKLAHEKLEQRVRERTAELESSQQDLHALSAQLMRIQDEEGRRIARELHDSAGQIITALGINLGRLGQQVRQTPSLAKGVEDSQDLVQQLNKEIRTMSYLLHPPLLDETGLEEAVRWYIEGVMERSGLHIDLSITESFGRLPGEMELALFRIIQECLTNVHRHSGSKNAAIRISRETESVSLEIEDEGKGISPEKLAGIQGRSSGVGITGIRERARHFGGVVDIQSSGRGTKILVNLPVSKTANSEPESALEQTKAAG